MATGGEQPSFAGCRDRCSGKSSARSGFCFCARCGWQSHGSTNRQTYDAIGRFRLTSGQKTHLAAVARMPYIDGGSDRRKTKITALTRPESGHDLFQPCRRHQLPRAQYVACGRVPRSFEPGRHSGQFRAGRQLRQIQAVLPRDLALRDEDGRGVSRRLKRCRGCDGIVLPPAQRIRGRLKFPMPSALANPDIRSAAVQ